MGVVDHAVADGISHHRLDELFVPVLRRDLGGHYSGRPSIAVLQDLDQVPAFLVLERPDEEIIQLCGASHNWIHVEHLVMCSGAGGPVADSGAPLHINRPW